MLFFFKTYSPDSLFVMFSDQFRARHTLWWKKTETENQEIPIQYICEIKISTKTYIKEYEIRCHYDTCSLFKAISANGLDKSFCIVFLLSVMGITFNRDQALV